MQTKLKTKQFVLLLLPCLALAVIPLVLKGQSSIPSTSAPTPIIVLQDAAFVSFRPIHREPQLLSYILGTWKIKSLQKTNVLEADTKVHLTLKYNPKLGYKRYVGSPKWRLYSSGIYTTDSKGRRYITRDFAPPFQAKHLGDNLYRVNFEVPLQQIPKQEGTVTFTAKFAVDGEQPNQITIVARK